MSANKYSEWFNIYYSQNLEDLILKALFPDVKNGFYIDVGAHDPRYFSVTKLFYDMGWNGINIEPQKKYHAMLAKDRKRDICLNVAIGSKKTRMSFREYPGADGLSTLSESMKSEYVTSKEYRSVTKAYSEYEVQVMTLDDVFNKYCKDKKVDFLKLDVEGFEKEALTGNNWTVNRPSVVCIESNHEAEEWHSIFRTANYNRFFHDGLNEYFIAAEEYKVISRRFNYPETVLRKIPLADTPYSLFNKEIKSYIKDSKSKDRLLKKQDLYITEQQKIVNNLDKEVQEMSKKIHILEVENRRLITKVASRLQKMLSRKQ